MSTGPYDVYQAAFDYSEGCPAKAIADQLGVSRSTLYKRLTRLGIRRRQVARRPLTTTERAEILRLSSKGLTVEQISEKTSRSASAVNQVRRAARFSGPRTHRRRRPQA